MKLKTKKNYKNKAPLIIIAAVVLALIVGGAVFAFYKVNTPLDTIQPGEQGVNLERSDSEKAAEEALKDNPEEKLENEQTDTPVAPDETTSSGKQAVNVVLTNAGIYNGTVSVGGMVTNVVEETGVCSYVFTNQGSVVTKTSTTLVNPTSTTCTTVNFPSSELPTNGTWTVKLNYSSAKSEGSSNTKEISK